MSKIILVFLTAVVAVFTSSCEFFWNPAKPGEPPNSQTPKRTSPLGVNLGAINYYQVDYPFVNLARTGEWRALNWGSISRSELTGTGYLPEGTGGYFLLISGTDVYPWPEEGCNLVFTYTGQATLTVTGPTKITSSPGRIEMTIPPQFSGAVYLKVENHTQQLGHFKMTEDYLENSTELYRQVFLDQWKDFSILRFMDWMGTNGSAVDSVADYPSDDYLLDAGLVRLSSLVELANRLNSDPWICIPHKADNALVTHLADYMKNHLNPGLRVYVEYSNECWNWMFAQTSWVRDQGVAAGLDPADQWGSWLRYYAKRTGEIHKIFRQTLGDDRVEELLAWQAYNPYQCRQVLDFYLEYQGFYPEALAVAPYFGNALGNDPEAQEVVTWDVPKLLTHLGFDTPSQLASGGNKGSLREVQSILTELAKVSSDTGVRLIAYEGGQHLVGVNTWQEDTTMTTLFTTANRSVEMKTLYQTYLDLWKEAGGQEFVLFNSTCDFTKYGSWGLKERWTDTSEAPKYSSALEWIQQNPRWW